MDHFKGISENERFNNELMVHMRKQTELLEQIAQLLQQPKGDMKNELHPTEGISINSPGKGQQRQRRGYSKRISGDK